MTDAEAREQAKKILGAEEKEEEEQEPSVSEEELYDANAVLIAAGIDETELSPEEAVEKAKRIEKAKVRAAQVLSRGRTLDSMQMALDRAPEGHVAQLVRDNAVDIARYKSLGYRVLIDDDYEGQAPSGKPDNRVACGDTIVMTIPREEFAAIDAARRERKAKRIAASAQKETQQKLEAAGVKTYTQ